MLPPMQRRRSSALRMVVALWFASAASVTHAQQTPPEPAPPEPPGTAEPAPEPTPAEPAPTPETSDAGQGAAGSNAAEGASDAPTPPPPPADDGDYAGVGASTDDDPLSYESSDEEETLYSSRSEDDLHEFSVRVDPLSWLLLGRFPIELEIGVWKFLSIELVPVLVTAAKPIALNYARLDDVLSQSSRGIGPISGASLGVGVWLFGEPFSGYVVRINFTNYAYTYEAADEAGVFDRVEHTERRLTAFFGSHSRFGAFTFAGGLGLGLELNQAERCRLAYTTTDGEREIAADSSNCNGHQLIAIDRDLSETADLNGPLHPVYFEARFSLGFVF
jgi:hypothetical protein